MDKEKLPKLPKNWQKLEGYKKVEDKKEKTVDVEVDGVYQTHVKDIIKILKIDEEKQSVFLYNISGAFNQWVDLKNLNIVKKIH